MFSCCGRFISCAETELSRGITKEMWCLAHHANFPLLLYMFLTSLFFTIDI